MFVNVGSSLLEKFLFCDLKSSKREQTFCVKVNKRVHSTKPEKYNTFGNLIFWGEFHCQSEVSKRNSFQLFQLSLTIYKARNIKKGVKGVLF